MECIFCNIIKGEIPSINVYEDEKTLVMMDINPVCDGHLLVMPKKHFLNIFDIEEEDLANIMSIAKKVAQGMVQALKIDSLNLLQANGMWALQSVPHFHLHLIPRRPDDGVGLDWPLVVGDLDSINKMAESISATFS